MNLICIGKLVNTHGIKGEVRIISDFKYKSDVFKIGNCLYIDDKKYVIKSYRIHKIYDMVTFEGLNKIEDVIDLKNSKVFIDRNDYNFKGVLDEDLIGLSVYDKDNYKGKIVDILKAHNYDLLVIDGKRKHMVPYIDEFVKNIDLSNSKIEIEYIRGLDNED